MPVSDIPVNYADGILQGLGANPDNRTAQDLLLAWMQQEGTSNPSNANFVALINNPLDSTQDEPGATPYNSFTADGQTYHVYKYPNFTTGISATISLLDEKQYATLKNAITTGNAKEFFSTSGSQELETAYGTGQAGASSYVTALHKDYESISGSQSPLNLPSDVGNLVKGGAGDVAKAASGTVSSLLGGSGKTLEKYALIVVAVLIIGGLMAVILYKGIIS